MPETGLAARRGRREEVDIWSEDPRWVHPRRTDGATRRERVREAEARWTQPPADEADTESRAWRERPGGRRDPHASAWREGPSAPDFGSEPEARPEPEAGEAEEHTAETPAPVYSEWTVAATDAPQVDSEWTADTPPVPGERRTVKITGRADDRLPAPRSRTARAGGLARHERPGFNPDRVAMWAVLLGALLVLIAATSAHAAVLAAHLPH